MSLRIGTTISSGTTTSSAKVPMRAIWLMPSPLCFSRSVPSCCAPGGTDARPMQSTVRPCVQ